jgi:hypothetical protein
MFPCFRNCLGLLAALVFVPVLGSAATRIQVAPK